MFFLKKHGSFVLKQKLQHVFFKKEFISAIIVYVIEMFLILSVINTLSILLIGQLSLAH